MRVEQRAQVKVETFSFTRYGTLSGVVSFVSGDAIADEKRGLVFQARVGSDAPTMRIDNREVTMSPSMAVTAEKRRTVVGVFDFFLDPIRQRQSRAYENGEHCRTAQMRKMDPSPAIQG